MRAHHRILGAGAAAPRGEISCDANGRNDRRRTPPHREAEAAEFQGKGEGGIAFIIKALSKTPHRAMALCITRQLAPADDVTHQLRLRPGHDAVGNPGCISPVAGRPALKDGQNLVCPETAPPTPTGRFAQDAELQ